MLGLREGERKYKMCETRNTELEFHEIQDNQGLDYDRRKGNTKCVKQ